MELFLVQAELSEWEVIIVRPWGSRKAKEGCIVVSRESCLSVAPGYCDL